ncbi:MAG: ribosome-associated translation inhibitor RaiA [Polyangiaceae bacterium]
MNISITFRQMEPSEAIKKYATTKVSRLQKLLQQPMTAKITLAVQKQLHVAEVQIASGRKRSEARESCEEMYASIDKVVDKLERQISTSKGEVVSKKRRSKATVRKGAETEELDVDDVDADADDDVEATPTKKTRPAAKKKTPAKKAKVAKKSSAK